MIFLGSELGILIQRTDSLKDITSFVGFSVRQEGLSLFLLMFWLNVKPDIKMAIQPFKRLSVHEISFIIKFTLS